MPLSESRREYKFSHLNRQQLNPNPFKQMAEWLNQAEQAKLKDATSMTLSTVKKNGMPDARIVLLKQFDETGLTWFTHYTSHKGEQLSNNAQACLSFYWREFDRQIKVQGSVEKIPAEASERYFHSRPLDSQFSAAASDQSHPIDSREQLENKLQQLKNINPNTVKKPESWGGYKLIPSAFEFWQGRESRLHDRFSFTLNPSNQWDITRLQP